MYARPDPRSLGLSLTPVFCPDLLQDNIASLLSSSPLNLTLTLRLEPGKSLDHFVDVSHHCTLAPADGAAVLCQQAGALSHLHSRRLIHDDVKPENIIWDPVAKRAVLIDFGAALNLATLPAGYFNPSGTPSYAPPEFFKRKKGPEGDVWALGVVLLFVWGYVRLPDGEWLLPGVWDEGGDVEMRRWLGEVSELRQRLTGGRPVLGEMLKEDPGERVSSAGLVCRLRAGEVS